MKPIGLSFKKDGELMIVHFCLNCGKISANRIAADDNAWAIINLLEKNCQPNRREKVLRALYGKARC